MRKFWILLLCLLIFSPQAYARYNPVITKYQMGIDVSEDKTFKISENINAYFYAPMHGIYRTLPQKGILHRAGGETENYKAKIKFISANTDYKIQDNWITNCNLSKTKCSSSYTGKYEIKLGNPDRYVEKNQLYKIKYLYKMPPDKMKDKDEVYYNLIGSEWEIPISNFSFVVRMPKDFDHSKIYFYDKNGDSKNVSYNVKDNLIIGKYNGEFQPGETLTIHVLLPEGYFVKPKFKFNLESIMDLDINFIPFIFPLVILLIIAGMWFLHGRDEKTVEVVEFEPPENLGPVDIAYIYSQDVSYENVATLIVHLANKGYIKIDEFDENKYKKDYRLIKLKEYEEPNKTERSFMNALFKQRDVVYSEEFESSNPDLITAVGNIIKETKKSYEAFFEKASLGNQTLAITLMILTWIGMSVYVAFSSVPVIIIHLILFPMVGYGVLSSGIKGLINKQANAFFTLIFGALWSFITIVGLGIFIITSNLQMIYPVIFTLLCIILMDIFRFYMPKWTPEGNKLYGRVLGFKNYLEKVEVDRLQRLVSSDPKYFYKIIPYAYVFGISQKWFAKYTKITCPPPDFYQGHAFGIGFLTGTMNHAISSVGMASTPVSKGSSGGSFGGGGGCSGGGGGGGGGGGW